MLTFNDIPKAMEQIQKDQSEIKSMLAELLGRYVAPTNEPPINGKELRKRLGISCPTETALRRKGKLPYFLVNGTYRYDWAKVQSALNNPKK